MEEIDIKEIITILLKKKMFIIITTLVFALIAFVAFSTLNIIASKQQATEALYYAETHFIVGTAEITNTNLEQPLTEDTASITITEKNRITQTTTLFETYSELMKSQTSLNKVIETLNLDIDANKLASLISISQISNSDLLSLTVAYKNEETAVQIADKLMSEFINNMKKAYSTDQVAVIDKAYILENSSLSNNPSVQAISSSHISNVPKFTIISAVVGFILSIGFVLLKEMFDDTIKSENDLEKIAESKNIILINKKESNNENQFVLLKLKLSGMKTILISTPEENKELSYISNNLANVFAKSKNKVLLLELNSDDSMLVKKYDYKTLLDSIHKDNKKISKLVSKSSTELFDVLYINQNVDNYLDEKQLKDFISALENIYDTIIVSSDNLPNNPCTFAVSKVVKNTLIVANERKTKINDFVKTNESLKNIKGFVLVK